MLNKRWDDTPMLLSNCPFCGGHPKLIHIGNERSKKRTIEIKCTGECRATMTNSALMHNFKWLEDVSAKAWNNRVINL